MLDVGNKLEINEKLEQKPEVSGYREIKPDGEITPQECREFWDDLFDSEISDEETNNNLHDDANESNVNETTEEDMPEKKGGSYGEVFKEGEGDKYEVHHMPAKSASNLELKDGPAIKMDKEDHRRTASCGSSIEAREYQAAQKELIEQGKFREALQMDIDDIHEKFGDKYDDAIAEMLEYVDKLEEEGKIDG